MHSLREYLQGSIRVLKNFLIYLKAKLSRRAGMNLYRITLTRGPSLRLHYITIFQGNHYRDLKLVYSLLHKEYYIEVWLKPLAEFIIRSSSSRQVLDGYPTKMDLSQMTVNYIEEPRAKSLKISRMFLAARDQICGEMILSSCCKSVPKVEGRNEDAYFCTDLNIGIADGVGGVFIDFGISSQDFSIELMAKCKEILGHLNSSKRGNEIVKEALVSMNSGGSSTYLLISLIKNRLMVSNYGDSGLMVFRKYNSSLRLVFQTIAKQHSFNTPFQVSKQFSPKQLQKGYNIIKDNIKNSNGNIDSDEYFTTVHEGDILVIGTDGLFDNLFPSEIKKIIKRFPKVSSLSETVDFIVESALARAKGIEFTPFEQNMKNIQCEWKGGKIDDITVIVSVVQRISYF